jgi:hypothetical protein
MYKLWCKIENYSTPTSSILVILDEQRDIWKGNVPLGNFNNVLVIKWPTQLIKFFYAK